MCTHSRPRTKADGVRMKSVAAYFMTSRPVKVVIASMIYQRHWAAPKFISPPLSKTGSRALKHFPTHTPQKCRRDGGGGAGGGIPKLWLLKMNTHMKLKSIMHSNRNMKHMHARAQGPPLPQWCTARSLRSPSKVVLGPQEECCLHRESVPVCVCCVLKYCFYLLSEEMSQTGGLGVRGRSR